MRRLKFVFFISLIFCFQNYFSQNSFGFKGGYTNAWENYGDNDVPADAEIAIDTYNFSLFYFKKFGKNVDIGVEPGFVRRGAACVPGFISPWIGDTRIQISYVDVPVNCRLKFPLFSERLFVFGKTGIGASAAIHAKEQLIELDSGEILNTRELEIGENAEVNRWNFGMYTGGGLELKAGPGNILLEANYYRAFTHAVNTTFSLNRNVNLNVGYSFIL